MSLGILPKKEIKLNSYVVFQDEAGCEKSNFFYHGFLFVKINSLEKILERIIEIKQRNNYQDKEVSFKDIRGGVSTKKEGLRASVAMEWLSLAKKLLKNREIKFYLFGVNKNNLSNFWEKWSYEKSIYVRFFEIGLKASAVWFSEDWNESEPFSVVNIIFEHGNYNDERKNKIKWLSSIWNKRYKLIDGVKDFKPLHSNEDISNDKISNILQFNDVLLGVCKNSFIKLSGSQTGKRQCVDYFSDVIEKFNNEDDAYDWKNNNLTKAFCLSFFPKPNDLTKEDFFKKDVGSLIKRGGYYCNRPTWRQREAQKSQKNLF